MKNIRRDEVDYLPEDRVYCLRCFWWCLFLHKPVGYRITPPVATLNIHPIANAVSNGMLMHFIPFPFNQETVLKFRIHEFQG